MLNYILHVIAFQLLFLLVYEILLKRETFFTWNRWYLLLTPLVSLLLPFIQIAAIAAVIPSGPVNSSVVWLPELIRGAGPEYITVSSAITERGQGFSINWWLVIYSVGMAGSLLIFLKKYNQLKRLFRFKIIASEKDFRIIKIPGSTIACTFYRTIFLGDLLSEAEKKQLLSHELVHVKQNHSLDLLFFELFKIIFWFNPLIYIYQGRMAMLHEFIADAAVVEETGKHSYYEQLLNSAFNSSNITFINEFFNQSLIKRRIKMLQRSRSKAKLKRKYLVLMPLIMGIVVYTSCSTSQNRLSEDTGIDYFENIETIKFYDNNGNETSIAEIRKNWNSTLQNYANAGISITQLRLMKIRDKETNNESLGLLANTRDETTKTAAELQKYKDGYKLSSTSVICTNCSSQLNPQMVNGNWSCPAGTEEENNCTRTSIAKS